MVYKGDHPGLPLQVTAEIADVRPRKELVLQQLLAREQQEGFQVAESVRQRLERYAVDLRDIPGCLPPCHPIHSAGVEIPTIIITYRNLTISANVEFGHRTLPTLPNTVIGLCKVCAPVHVPQHTRVVNTRHNRQSCALWASLPSHTAARCSTTCLGASSRYV